MMEYAWHSSQSCPVVPGGFAERWGTGGFRSMTAGVRFHAFWHCIRSTVRNWSNLGEERATLPTSFLFSLEIDVRLAILSVYLHLFTVSQATRYTALQYACTNCLLRSFQKSDRELGVGLEWPIKNLDTAPIPPRRTLTLGETLKLRSKRCFCCRLVFEM